MTTCKNTNHWSDMMYWGHCLLCKHMLSEFNPPQGEPMGKVLPDDNEDLGKEELDEIFYPPQGSPSIHEDEDAK